MAMLRRLHALGTKSGSDPAGHLLRSLSTRNNNSNGNAATAATAQGADDTGSANSAGLERRNRCLGAIGPASNVANGSRYAVGNGNSPNRGLSGLAGTGAWTWSGSDAVNGSMGAARSLSSGPEPTSRSAEEDEESTLSSLLGELDDIRNSAGAVLDDDDDGRFDPLAAGADYDMNETVDAPPLKPKQKDMGFDAYGLNPRLQQQLKRAGIDKLFPVQAQCFEKVVGGQDLMCKSRTGSGKTLAFAIPIIEALDRQSGGQAVERQRGGRGRLFSRGAYGRFPRAICVAPTRELAKQVDPRES
ncbi:unnamed protein product [Hapterophycus canaliculatus]